MAADGGHGLAGEGELKGRQEAQPEERGGQVEVGDGEDVGRSVAEDGGERERRWSLVEAELVDCSC